MQGENATKKPPRSPERRRRSREGLSGAERSKILVGSILKRFREPIFVAALMAIPFVIFFVKAKKGRDLNALDRVVIALTAPVEKTITVGTFAAVDAWHGYVALRGVHEENLVLRRENL